MADELEDIVRRLPGRPLRHQTFRLGDTVRILSGPFAAFTGKIEGINQAKWLLKVKVEIFGRETPVKLSFTDVEKVSGF
jgi:transcriptional antiterminator NusG